MSAGKVQFYYGEGHGKSTAAMGLAIQAAIEGKEATIIQFLKGKIDVENTFMSSLEPEIKVFNFAKSEVCFDELDEEKRQEEIMNLRNGYNYSKKVIGTEMTDLVVLDEILGLVDQEVISVQEFKDLIDIKPENMTIICTGRVLHERMRPYADEIYNIAPEK